MNRRSLGLDLAVSHCAAVEPTPHMIPQRLLFISGEAMQHGGQWPASSTHTTSVGIDAIYRFMRPVSYQSFAQEVLPAALQDANPWKVEQRIN